MQEPILGDFENLPKTVQFSFQRGSFKVVLGTTWDRFGVCSGTVSDHFGAFVLTGLLISAVIQALRIPSVSCTNLAPISASFVS